MANYALIVTKDAWLWTDFGADYAARIMPADMLDALPRYVRGAKAGKIKDHMIEWDKVERGGFVPPQMVERRVGKVIRARLVKSPWGRPSEVVAEFFKDKDGNWVAA